MINQIKISFRDIPKIMNFFIWLRRSDSTPLSLIDSTSFGLNFWKSLKVWNNRWRVFTTSFALTLPIITHSTFQKLFYFFFFILNWWWFNRLHILLFISQTFKTFFRLLIIAFGKKIIPIFLAFYEITFVVIRSCIIKWLIFRSYNFKGHFIKSLTFFSRRSELNRTLLSCRIDNISN